MDKVFEIREFDKDIKVSASDIDGDLLVSACEYRRRKTDRQIAFERAKWEGLGYREVRS